MNYVVLHNAKKFEVELNFGLKKNQFQSEYQIPNIFSTFEITFKNTKDFKFEI